MAHGEIAREHIVRVTVQALGIGALAAVAASLFLVLVERGQALLFEHLPETFGWTELPWWWPVLTLVAAAPLIWLSWRLPGGSGGSALSGFHFTTPARFVPAALLAAMASLIAGASLGPEAPLIILGSSIAAVLARRDHQKEALMVLGGLAAIGAIFGSPFITAFMALEMVALGVLAPTLIVPALAALASSYLVQIGIGSIPGFGVHSLALPGVKPYDALQPIDLAVGVLAILVSAALLLVIVQAATRWQALGQARPGALLLASLGLVALVFALASGVAGVPVELLLFSGNEAMPSLLGVSSLGLVLAVVLSKGTLYLLAMGGGFRGGAIFPAAFLGIGVATALCLLIPGASVEAVAAATIATASAVMTRLPAASALIGALLIPGMAVAPLAILGAIIGFLARIGLDRKVKAAATPVVTTGPVS